MVKAPVKETAEAHDCAWLKLLTAGLTVRQGRHCKPRL